MSVDKEIVKDDNKTSRLEVILKQGKNLLYTAWGSWIALQVWALGGVEGVNIRYGTDLSGDPALEIAGSLFPVVTAWTGAYIAIIAGKSSE